ncbi:MAG TPA: hypothetical protein VIT67_09325 [Povalibacter sp.]
MNLTHEEKNSPLWHRLRTHLEERIAKLREENDKTQTPEGTERLRGKIAALKELRDLEKPAPAINE